MNEEIKEILNNDIPIFVIDSDGYTIDITETIHNVITNLQQENEKLKNFITNLISELSHCELNGTKKLDIVSDYIKQEYENILNGSDEK